MMVLPFNDKFRQMHTYQKIVSFILFAGMLCFLTGFFWQVKYSRLHTLYFILVVLPSLILIPIFIREQLHKNKLFLLILIFCLYSLMSVFWVETFQPSLFVTYLKRVAVLIVLFYAVYHIVLLYPSSEKIIFILLMISGFGLLVFSLWVHFQQGLMDRLILLGGLNDPISSATVYGALFLLSAGAYLREKNKYRLFTYLLLSLAFVLEILLTKSRGPQLALLLSLPLLFLIIKPVEYKRVYYPLILALILILFIALGTNFFDTLLSRGFHLSFRDIIWEDSIKLSLEKPLFGYGLGTEFKFILPAHELNLWRQSTVSHSHNFILSTWLYTGVIGVALILAIIYYALSICFTNKKESYPILGVIMVFGVFCLLTNGSYPISRANERWFIFWIPLAFILANSIIMTNNDKDSE